jgi:predicted small secreted protein
MRKIIVLAALAASLAVSACNTVAGAGRDVSATGHAVTNTAEDAKPGP